MLLLLELVVDPVRREGGMVVMVLGRWVHRKEHSSVGTRARLLVMRCGCGVNAIDGTVQ